jgi:hypothetical protein
VVGEGLQTAVIALQRQAQPFTVVPIMFPNAVKAQLAVIADVSAQNRADVRKLKIDQKAGQYQRFLAFWGFCPAIPAFHYISPLHAAESKSHHISCRQAFEFFRFVCQIDCIAVCVFLFRSGKEQTELLRQRLYEKWADRSNNESRSDESRSDSHRHVTLRCYLTGIVPPKQTYSSSTACCTIFSRK